MYNTIAFHDQGLLANVGLVTVASYVDLRGPSKSDLKSVPLDYVWHSKHSLAIADISVGFRVAFIEAGFAC